MRCLITALILLTYSQIGTSASTVDADAVFSWAETQYPDYFPAEDKTSGEALGYYYRYYPSKNNYLGFKPDEQNIYYWLSDDAVKNAGNIQSYQAQAAMPPDTATALQTYLRAGVYKNWVAEPQIHQGSAAHGTVKTYFNPSLVDTLSSNAAVHGMGAASIKELYSGNTLTGWAVSIKTQTDSDKGNGWYWYEVFSIAKDAKAASSGNGVKLCSNCHGDGHDFIRAALPASAAKN